MSSGCRTVHFFHDLEDDGGRKEMLRPTRLIVAACQEILHNVDARLVVPVGELVVAALEAIAATSLS